MLGRTKSSPSALKERLAAVAEELIALHRDLYWLAEDSNLPEQEDSLGDLTLDEVMSAKLAVDNLRDLLWKYVDAISKVEPERVQEAVQSYRLRRVTKLLDLLRKRLGTYSDQQPVSFIERISAAIKEKLKNQGQSDKAA
jgi:hypothetical protein